MVWKVIIGVIFFVSIVGTIIIVTICVENETMDIFLLLGKRKVHIGDNHRNYLKCKGKCGTCKYHKGYTDSDSIVCKLDGITHYDVHTCDYYKMHRCFKKYKGRI